MTTEIRDEKAGDEAAIRAVTQAAFATVPHASGTEAAIVEALREAGALAVSLVAVEGGEIVGHVAFSPVRIDGADAPGWFGVGPVSVRPGRQRAGIGSALMHAGLDRLRQGGAKGCVLVGDPAYYCRFGFAPAKPLVYPDLPAEYFQVKDFGFPVPSGTVAFHPAFGAREE